MERRRLRLLVLVTATMALIAACSSGGSSGAGSRSSASDAGSGSSSGSSGAVHLVVLGDSYSAGNAAGDYSGPPQCFRSANDYGHVVGADIQARTHRQVTVDVNACSGATTASIDGSFAGQPPQIEAVTPSTDLVMLSIGGNDANFTGIVASCLFSRNAAGPQYDASGCALLLDGAETLLSSGMYADHLDQVLTSIARHGGSKTRIVLVGYPYLEASTTLTGAGPGGTTVEIGARLRQLQITGSRIEAETVTKVNKELGRDAVSYVSTAPGFAGHEITAAEPYEPQATNPDLWIQAPSPAVDLHVWYHPKAAGHRSMADSIEHTKGALGDLL